MTNCLMLNKDGKRKAVPLIDVPCWRSQGWSIDGSQDAVKGKVPEGLSNEAKRKAADNETKRKSRKDKK